ncbi:UNVERIFIED_CONTAM: hypothetical protein FKN15_008263 [Acipenser sinensis]
MSQNFSRDEETFAFGPTLQSREAWMEESVTRCFRGIDTRIVHLCLSPRSTLLYQKQCEIVYPTRMTLGPDPVTMVAKGQQGQRVEKQVQNQTPQ